MYVRKKVNERGKKPKVLGGATKEKKKKKSLVSCWNKWVEQGWGRKEDVPALAQKRPLAQVGSGLFARNADTKRDKRKKKKGTRWR